MIYRCILPGWAKESHPHFPFVREGEFTDDQLRGLNSQGYNCYYLPNYPKVYDPATTVDGTHIDTFTCVFVDMDLKSGEYQTKSDFLAAVGETGLTPSRVVDSGNGTHVYWNVSDLDAQSYLRLQRRLCRLLKTDEAVSKIYQLMRVPGTWNTKVSEDFKLCETLADLPQVYTCEELEWGTPSYHPRRRSLLPGPL